MRPLFFCQLTSLHVKTMAASVSKQPDTKFSNAPVIVKKRRFGRREDILSWLSCQVALFLQHSFVMQHVSELNAQPAVCTPKKYDGGIIPF